MTPILQFLRETYELWYWALFRPSRLQARMNAWAPHKEKDGQHADTRYFHILLWNIHPRFLAQFVLLSLVHTLPLMVLVATNGTGRDWLLVPVAILSAYGMAVWFLLAGLLLSLLLALAYANQVVVLRQTLDITLSMLPPLPQLILGMGSALLGLVLSTLVGFWLWQHKQIWSGRIMLSVGPALSVAIGGWLATQDEVLFWFIMSGVINILLLIFLRNEPEHNDPDRASIVAGSVAGGIAVGVVFGVAFGVAVGIAGVVAGGVAFVGAGGVAVGVAGVVAVGVAGGMAVSRAGGVAGIVVAGVAIGVASIVVVGVAVGVAGVVAISVAGIPFLTLPWLLLTSWLIGFHLAPLRWRWSGWLVPTLLVVMTWQQQGLMALVAGLIALVGNYRLVSLTMPFNLLSLGWRILPRRVLPPAMALLRHLPPHGDEVLWWPLMGQRHVLAAAFREDASSALAIVQQMRDLPYSGYRPSIEQALPQIIADQLAQVQTLDQLIATAQPDHALLTPLVPAFYQYDESGQRVAVAPGQDETTLVFPRLLAIASDASRAIEAANPALAERGLEQCLMKLRTLQGQLPGLGLRSPQVARWKPAFAQWEDLLEQAIATQRTLSQGELLNPFQTGNPVRPERKDLFKGRTLFVNDVLRSVYDTSRPTLVLHGPRRCGKSSFLLNLPRLLPSDVLPVYYSLQTPAATSSTGDFCYGLVRSIRRDLSSQGISTPDAERTTFQAKPYTALEDWLDAATPRFATRSLLLCFDEFEQLGHAVAQGQVERRIFDQLRDLIQHSHFSFLFCGVQTLNELGPNWSNYFISVRPMEMTYLEPDAAYELLTNPDPAFALRYAAGVVERVIDVTRCQPYLLQLIGEAMVRQANQHQTRLLTLPLLDAAFEAALTAGEPYFTNLWDEYTGTSPDEVQAGRAILHAVAQQQPLPASETPAAQAALQRLLRYHTIEQVDGGYRCEVPFVARWVRERAVG